MLSTSLSPRPDKQMTSPSSCFIVGASFNAYATACELSNAGIIPSFSLAIEKHVVPLHLL